MRTHFSLFSSTDDSATLSFLDNRLSAQVFATVACIDGDWMIGDFMTSRITKETIRIMKSLEEAVSAVGYRAADIIAFLKKAHGKQIVWDEKNSKFRNVTTMKAGADHYTADGTDISISAKSEEIAKKRLATKITAAMIELPEQAADFASWFANGCPVTKTEDGSCPEAPSLDFLGEVVNKGTPAAVAKRQAKQDDTVPAARPADRRRGRRVPAKK